MTSLPFAVWNQRLPRSAGRRGQWAGSAGTDAVSVSVMVGMRRVMVEHRVAGQHERPIFRGTVVPFGAMP